MIYNIAIDGPAGAGKSTIAKMAAKKLDFIYVDTGAMYRAMALYFLRREIDAKDEKKIAEACEHINVTIAYQEGEQQVLLNGENVNAFIRTEEVSMMTSNTSKYPAVREKLLYLQRELAAANNVVMDGRDIGTVVLPDAEVKVFLTASAEERARRRMLELEERGTPEPYAAILRAIQERDWNDTHRDAAPLRQAEDAVLLDTTALDFVQSEDALLHIIRERTGL